MTPSLSVCIPVHNGGEFLAGALDSVLAQTAADFAIVISDNASTDDTPAIVERYARHDSRIQASRSEEFLAQADSINRALDLAETEWIKPLCHDDRLEPSCVERLQDVVAALPDGVGLVGHGESHLYANGYLDRPAAVDDSVHVAGGPETLRRLLGGGSPVVLPSLTTAVVRRAAWAASDHFDARFAHADVFCWARMLTRWDYAHIDSPLTINRIHGGQVAVAARSSRRTTWEQHQFWNAFVDEFGGDLRLSRPTVVRTRLRGAAMAGTAAAIHLLKGQPGAAVRELGGSPSLWWPLLPVLTARGYFRERARIHDLRAHVPVDLIYP